MINMGRAYDFIRKVGDFINPLDRGDLALSVEEIAERMKPVPYEQIEHRLPLSFARTMKDIYEAEESAV